MQSIQQRLASKHDSLGKWRRRYPKSEYPKKVALNVMGSALLAATLADQPDQYFGNGHQVSSVQAAIARINKESDTLNRSIAKQVDDKVNGRTASLGAYSDVVNFDSLMNAVRQGASGDSQVVERIEYNWVYNALQGDLMELWLVGGLMGMDKLTAFNELFYFVNVDARLSTSQEVYGMFGQLSGTVLAVPDAYRPMPALW